MLNKEKRVLVGMSGGIDSSAACIMLQEKGFEVVGVTMRTWDIPSHFSNPEQEQPDEILEAQALAARLGIEHHVADVRKEFRQVIVQYFIDEYMRGRTPNPCVIHRDGTLLPAGRTERTALYCHRRRPDERPVLFPLETPAAYPAPHAVPLRRNDQDAGARISGRKGVRGKSPRRRKHGNLLHRQRLPRFSERALSGHRRAYRAGVVCQRKRSEIRATQRFRLLHHRPAQGTGDCFGQACVCIENQSG